MYPALSFSAQLVNCKNDLSNCLYKFLPRLDVIYIEINQSNQNLIRETSDLPKNLNDRETILKIV